jgi:glycosyltransferase involved in cell wall biosynthesis
VRLPEMNPIRILFLPPVDADSTNAQSLNTREIALRLDPAKFECVLFYWTAPDQRLLGRPHIRLVKMPARAKTLRILRELFSGYHIVAYMDYSPASYLYLHIPRFLRGRTKTVLHAEGRMPRFAELPWLFRFMIKGTVGRCDVYTGITEYVAQDISRVAKRRVRYMLPVGVDCELFTPPRQRVNSTPAVVFVGAVIERKGPQYLLDAARRFPSVQFRIIGAGREGYDEVLHGQIAASGLTNVRLEGAKSQVEIAGAMQESDILMLPSRLEGLPKVTLEADAAALPCIVFRDYETPSVVDGVTGYQVSTWQEMLDRLGQLLADPDLRRAMGRAARQHAMNFTWDAIARKWEAAYLAIAAES